MGSTLKRSAIFVMLAAGLLAGMLATSAVVSAFTVPATSIFKVATYSSTTPVDGSGRGWLGMAFSPTGVLHAIAADGNLYAASASGPAPVTMSAVGAVGAGASGLAFGLDGKLYATSSAGVLEINPTTAATIRLLAATGPFPSLSGPDGLAIDPVSGDLFVTSSQFVYWIATPSAPVTTAVIYTSLRRTATVSHGISINTDGTLYVASDVQIWRVTNPHALPTGITVPTPEPIVAGTGLRGVAVVTNNVDTVARFVFTNDTSGAISRYAVPPAGGTPAQVVTVGDRGDFMAVGPDHCAYAAQGGAILRISRDDGTTFGTCDLVAPATPPATMALTATGGSLPRVGATQTFEATVQNAPLPDGTPVTFTITGPNFAASDMKFAKDGRALFAYAATEEGTDVITASTTIAGGLTSNSVQMVWGPAYDPIPPIISYSVAGAHGVGFQCIVSTTVANTDYCGYYTSPPTVTWTVIKGGTAALDPRTTCSPFPLTASTGPAGIPVTCRASNTDGATSSRTVVLQALLLPPTITATMALDNGQPYAGGYTNHSVTVTFTCTDAAGNSTPSCSAPVTVSADGAGQTVSASATDAAGTTATATFGPISIDKALPTISAIATLPGGALYGTGSWTNQDVTLTFTCGDAGVGASGIVSCPLPVTVRGRQVLVTTSVNDNAGNIGSTSVGPINIDKTAPMITATAMAGGTPFTGSLTNKTVVVTFACVSDLAPVTCPGTQTFANEGTFTASAGVSDAAGNAAVPATFGPFTIDKTPPTVTAAYKTADGAGYVLGTPTAQNVLATFTCTDAVDSNPTCPGGLTRTITITSSQSVSGTSTDAAGNTGASTPGQVVIDRTGPTLSAIVTPTPDVNGNNVLTATVTVTATDPSGVSSITYSASGAQPIASATVSAGGTTTFVLAIPLAAAGSTVVNYSATDAAGNVSTGSVTIRIVLTQVSTLTITSAPALTQGGTSVSATLVGPGGIPVIGRTVSFTAGNLTATGVTDATGTATATLALAAGQYSLTAAFGGDAGFYASTAGPQSISVGAATQFVIWGGNAGGVQIGQRVVFWGEHWWDTVNLADKSKVKDFKGWASTVSGNTWTTKTGNSKPPETLATYISVIITTNIDRGTGEGITGNVVRHAILRVDSPYKDEPSKPVYGVVVALLP